MRYKTSDNIGVKLNLADKTIQYLYLAIVSSIISLSEMHKYFIGNSIVVSFSTSVLLLAVLYIVYMVLCMLAIRFYNHCVYPTNLFIEDGKIILQSYVYRLSLEAEFIESRDLDKSVCEKFNVFEPVCISINKNKIVVLDKVELGKLSSL